jgi:hypothetical protein
MRTLANFFALAMAVVVDASEKPEELVWGANMYSSAGTFVQGPARPFAKPWNQSDGKGGGRC